MLETLPACIILHLRSRKDFAGKTKRRRTGLKQKTINLPLLIWIYVIYWFLNCLSPEEKKPKETIYIVSFSNRSKLKPFKNGNGRVVSSSSTSLTHSQVNLLVIKSTPMYLLPRESGLIMKINASGFSLFTADQVLLLLTLMSWPIHRALSEGWDFKSETKGAGGFGWREWGGLHMRRQSARHLNQNHYLEKLQQCGCIPESHDLHIGPVYQTWL